MHPSRLLLALAALTLFTVSAAWAQLRGQRSVIHVYGTVVMDDGTPPPEPVAIERVCQRGVSRREGYTDAKGNFSVRMGADFEQAYQDATASGRSRERTDDPLFNQSQPAGAGIGMGVGSELTTCELRGVLAGYVSSTINLAILAQSNRPDYPYPIVLYRTERVPGLLVSATTLKAPKDAKKAFEKGMKAKDIESAEKHFREAVTVYPEYADAWVALGLTHEQRQRLPEAREAYEKAVALDANLVRPYVQLAIMSVTAGNWKEAADLSARAISLHPSAFPNVYFANALANFNLANADVALVSAKRAHQLDHGRRMPGALLIIASVLNFKGDHAGAAQHLRTYLEWVPNAADAAQVRSQLAEIEKKLGTASATAPPSP